MVLVKIKVNSLSVRNSLHFQCFPNLMCQIAKIFYRVFIRVNFTELSLTQDSTPVGCIPPACQPYVFQWPPLDVSTGGRGGGLGPQVNKFEQVSNDDHQMSVAEGRQGRCQVWCPTEGVGAQVWCLGEGDGGTYHMTYPIMYVMYIPSFHPFGQNDWLTDTCESITLPQLLTVLSELLNLAIQEKIRLCNSEFWSGGRATRSCMPFLWKRQPVKVAAPPWCLLATLTLEM